MDDRNRLKATINHSCRESITIREYKPGDLGYINYIHCKLYESEYSLDGFSFEQYVLPNMAKFVASEDKEGSNVWVADYLDQIIGSIAIIKSDIHNAQLRWFLIEPQFRGVGLGKSLMTTAIDYCQTKGYKKVFLWTIDILHPARFLYESFGFQLTETKSHFIWGQNLTEERWELNIQQANK